MPQTELMEEFLIPEVGHKVGGLSFSPAGRRSIIVGTAFVSMFTIRTKAVASDLNALNKSIVKLQALRLLDV